MSKLVGVKDSDVVGLFQISRKLCKTSVVCVKGCVKGTRSAFFAKTRLYRAPVRDRHLHNEVLMRSGRSGGSASQVFLASTCSLAAHFFC